MNRDRSTPERVRKPIKLRDEKFVFYKRYSQDFWIAGYKSKVCNQSNIADYFDVQRSTVLRWGQLGALPKPFVIVERGGKPQPLYLSAQLRILRIVLGDLVAEGYVTIPWHLLGDHITMLHEGYEMSARNHRRRMTEVDILDEQAGKFGVIFDD